MSMPKLQHYVPQMILRRFTDGKGLLYCWRGTDSRKPWNSKPKKVFAENHLYTLHNNDGELDVSIENDFSVLEGKVSGIIDKIVEVAQKGQTPCLDADEKNNWLRYLCRQRRRTRWCSSYCRKAYGPTNRQISGSIRGVCRAALHLQMNSPRSTILLIMKGIERMLFLVSPVLSRGPMYWRCFGILRS